MKKIRFVIKYLVHLLNAKNTKGHGIHSPYLYRFTQNAIYEKNPFYIFPEIEALREHLYFDDRVLDLKDFGTGQDRETHVMDIAKKSLKKRKYGQLLYRIVHFLQAKQVLELGTSLGITTSYLASGNSDIRCVSMEGSEAIVKIARENFEKLQLENIELIVGNLDETLSPTLNTKGNWDVIFFDANHRKAPTLNYFLQCLEHIHRYSVFIFDDIHWSEDMEDAWNEIRKHESVTVCVDLFEIGIVFFNKDFPKKTFKMTL
ncbi:MAG: O-methyltransferase [Paludibacteraceae bacterium]